MSTGYCTVDDVRRVLQEADLTGALEEDNNQVVIDAISGLRHWIELITHKHWYVPDGIAEDSHDLIPTEPNTRDDEHDIATKAGSVIGHRRNRTNTIPSVLERNRIGPEEPKIRIASGDRHDDEVRTYTRIRLERTYVQDLNELHVINEDGGFDDWVADSDFDGGVGNQFRGDDYWVRINNRGVSELYLDIHAMDDDLPSLANAVYVDIDFGQPELPSTVRRSVAMLAASELVLDDEAAIGIPDSGQLVNVETKAQRLERQGLQKLKPHLTKPIDAVRVPAV